MSDKKPTHSEDSSQKAKNPGGTGVPPVQTFQVTWRNLPHWQEPGQVYFLTWRCRDRQLLSPEERTMALDALLYWDNRKWRVYVAVILPDHVHFLAQPLSSPQGGVFNLSEMVHCKEIQQSRNQQTPGRQGLHLAG
jgi:hypothetical protein